MQQQGAMVVVTHAEPAAAEPASVIAGERAYLWSRSGTLRLYVQPTSELADWSPHHLALVDEAARAWTASGAVRIQIVSWVQESDIRLYWTDRLPPTNPGITMLYRNRSGRLSRADMFISVKPAPWNTGSPERVLFGTIAHELGHAIGLAHDPAPGALMHPAPLVTRITEGDVAKLTQLMRGP